VSSGRDIECHIHIQQYVKLYFCRFQSLRFKLEDGKAIFSEACRNKPSPNQSNLNFYVSEFWIRDLPVHHVPSVAEVSLSIKLSCPSVTLTTRGSLSMPSSRNVRSVTLHTVCIMFSGHAQHYTTCPRSH
jgi:hypothetical protein